MPKLSQLQITWDKDGTAHWVYKQFKWAEEGEYPVKCKTYFTAERHELAYDFNKLVDVEQPGKVKVPSE